MIRASKNNFIKEHYKNKNNWLIIPGGFLVNHILFLHKAYFLLIYNLKPIIKLIIIIYRDTRRKNCIDNTTKTQSIKLKII